MRVNKTDAIEDQPVRKIRDFLRKLGSASTGLKRIGDEFGLSDADAPEFAAELIRRKLLQKSEFHASNQGVLYKWGPEASRLVNAKFLKPMTRRQADTLIADLLKRIQQANQSLEFVYRVGEVRVFGSYLNVDRSDFADVDIAIRFDRRSPPNGKRFVDWALERAYAAGRNLSYMEMLFYAKHEMRVFLKARRARISLHDMDDLEEIGAPSQIIYSIDKQ